MAIRRRRIWLFLLLATTLGVTGCEPYMSLTDRIPAQTRQATALLPEAPRYVGMVDLETVMGQIDALNDLNFADSLRRANDTPLHTFLDATGMTPRTDLKAVYGAVEGGSSFSAVLFADLTPAQMDQYLERAPEGHVRSVTYRDVPVYHLHAGSRMADAKQAPDTLSLAFVGNGVIAAATDPGLVRTMIERHQSEAIGFRDNKSYMTLVERVGHGSTAWLVGRDVLQTAFRDSTGNGTDSPSTAGRSLGMSEAGFQQLLSGWADRVLGLTDAPSTLEGSAGKKIEQLERRIRDQAVSITLADETVEGELYLTMQDEASAANVVDVSRGAMAALRLSKEGGEEGRGRFIDDVRIEQDGPIVHVQFALEREHLRSKMQEARAARPSKSSIRRAKEATRRLLGITAPGAA